MNIKTMLVFYGEDNLPYKDKERQTHYPVSGSDFMGASNTTEIRFYIDRIGDSSTTWVANAKLPNGKTGYKVLTAYHDSEINENYVLLPLDNFYTQAKGDIYISLGGYAGGVEIVEDEETGIYSLVGTPTIQATGTVKLAINYTTLYTGGTEQGIDIQQLIALLGQKINKNAEQYFRVVDTYEDINSAENRDFLVSGALVMTADTGDIYLLSGSYPFTRTKMDFFQEKFIKANVRAYTNSTDLANDLTKLAENQIVLYNADGKIVCYKVKSNDGQKTYEQQKLNVFWDSIIGDIEDNQELIDYLNTHYASSERIDDLESDLESEITARENADQDLQDQIDDIVAKSDVVDIVGAYADLQTYDKSKLGDNDIIKVLVDETHDNAISYYRYIKSSNTFTYINSIGPYSKVSASATGTSTNIVRFITIDGVEYKLPTGGGTGGGIIVSVSEDSEDLPQITAEQMTTIYNAIAVDGSNVVLQTETDKQYVVLGAKAENDIIIVYILLSEETIVKYTLEDEEEYATATTKQIGGAVSSVNSKTGAVVLSAEDIKIADGDVRNTKAVIDNAYTEIERVEQETQETTDDLQDQIDNLSSRGRYLSGWNALTGLPLTEPTTELPYEYRAGDYYVISVINYADYDSTETYNLGDHCYYNGNNYTCNENGVSGEFDSSKWTLTTPQRYKPSGTEYDGQPSTATETNEIKVNDTYMYDGDEWVYQATAPVDLSNYVDKTSNQTIGGNKSFTSNIRVNSASNITDMGGTPLEFGTEVSATAQDTDKLASITIDGTTYKNIRFSEGHGGGIGIGTTTITGLYGCIAIGKYSVVRGNCSVAIGQQTCTCNSNYSVAFGYGARNYIDYTFCIDGDTEVAIKTYQVHDLSHIWFRNELVSTSKTTFASYTLGYTLAERLNGLTLTDNSITELDYDHINKMTLSADRTFTFRTAPTSTGTNLSAIPEYKALITTNAQIDITLPSGTYKLFTNDEDNIVLTDNVLSLPNSSEIELSIQNGKIIAINWSL